MHWFNGFVLISTLLPYQIFSLECGEFTSSADNVLETRIVNGELAVFGEFPWQVTLQRMVRIRLSSNNATGPIAVIKNVTYHDNEEIEDDYHTNILWNELMRNKNFTEEDLLNWPHSFPTMFPTQPPRTSSPSLSTAQTNNSHSTSFPPLPTLPRHNSTLFPPFPTVPSSITNKTTTKSTTPTKSSTQSSSTSPSTISSTASTYPPLPTFPSNHSFPPVSVHLPTMPPTHSTSITPPKPSNWTWSNTKRPTLPPPIPTVSRLPTWSTPSTSSRIPIILPFPTLPPRPKPNPIIPHIPTPIPPKPGSRPNPQPPPIPPANKPNPVPHPIPPIPHPHPTSAPSTPKPAPQPPRPAPHPTPQPLPPQQKPSEWQWRWQHFCGGSIINHHWILTAAHCVESMKNTYVPGLVQVTAGSLNWRVPDSQYAQVIAVDKVYVHDGWSQQTGQNDVALLHLAKPISYVKKDKIYVNNICLSRETENEYEGVASSSGWGFISKDHRVTPEQLRRVDLLVVDHNTCRNAFSRVIRVTRKQVCAGRPPKGNCMGDSGGPLIQKYGNRAVQIGIVSFSIPCAVPGYPDVFTRVSMYIDWISAITGLTFM
ncbi:dual specificity protein phosphatase 14-like [Sarcoptes scabiei]|nr:dual specificity protein phosphatase 14-like [Sarcoptes scabiei]